MADETGAPEGGDFAAEVTARTKSPFDRERDAFHQQVAIPRIKAEIPQEEFAEFSAVLERKGREEKASTAAAMASVFERALAEHKANRARKPGPDYRNMPDDEFKAHEARLKEKWAAASEGEALKTVDRAKAESKNVWNEVAAVTNGRGIRDLSDKEFAALEQRLDAARNQRKIATATLSTFRARPKR